MPAPNLNEQLDALGYSADWLDFGVLSLDTLNRQTDDFRTGRDPNTEHYRYDTFRTYLCGSGALSDAELSNYMALADHDPDPAMASAALVDLFRLTDLTDSQFARLCEHLEGRGEGTAKIARRQRLLRRMRGQHLTDDLFYEGLDSGDATVQRHMLPIASLEQLRHVAERGVSRKVRDEATRRQRALERAASAPSESRD